MYVDEDLGKEERVVQKRLRWMAFEERRKGRRIEVGHGGLWIGEKWFGWDEEEGRLKDGKEKDEERRRFGAESGEEGAK